MPLPFHKVSCILYLVSGIRNKQNLQFQPFKTEGLTKYKILNTKYRKPKGFTLIELLVTISIIAILMAAGTVYFTNAQVKGRDSKRKADIKSIQQALELYYNTNGDYPPPPAGSSGGWCTYLSNPGVTAVKDALVPAYISELPKDPTYKDQSGDYFYYRPVMGQYRLYAVLENANDPEKLSSLPENITGCWGYSSKYNYRVTQP